MSSADQKSTLRRLVHFTPLRYPGGKGKLSHYVKRIIEVNGLSDGKYVEPYAGGCGVGLELLFHEYVSEIFLNDISPFIHSFWWSVLNRSDELCRRIVDTPVTPEEWKIQKNVLTHYHEFDPLSVGFATFFLNRTNRSGILNGGMIGGKDQSGPWKIDARYNASELAFRIESIAKLKHRINLSSKDAAEFIAEGTSVWPSKTLIYCDPPYYRKGRALYYDFYQHDDHVRIAKLMIEDVVEQRWIVSYDNVDEIRAMYPVSQQTAYLIG
jgi:DNA adenine methylase